jgi:ketosteroid isomerase-like protein
VRQTEAIEFGGSGHKATSGDYPYGGVVHSIHGESVERPLGLVFDFGETARIEVALSDWRRVGEHDLPFLAIIDDGDRVFDYRYTSIDLEPQSPLWFYEALPAPAINEVQIHRLHRKLLAAHCLGDAVMMAELTAPSIFSANRGQLQTASNDELLDRFNGLFEQLDYREYHDLIEPLIEVSESGDLGWIAVEVRAVGEVRESGQAFNNQWAWLMAVRKVDGAWLHVGNASNLAQ